MFEFVEAINKKYTVTEAWQLCFGQSPPTGKCFCPFHDNKNSPAAKVYDYGMRCYGSCGRVYSAYNFLKKFRPDILEEEKKELHPRVIKETKKTQQALQPLTGTLEQKLETVIKYLSYEN